MKKRDFLAFGFIISIILVSIINIFTGIINKYTFFIIFLVLINAAAIFLLGYRKNKSVIEKDTIVGILFYLLFYYIMKYSIGEFSGFNNNIYNLTFLGIIKNIVPAILIIILEELLRYNLCKKTENNTLLIIFTCIAMIAITNTMTIRSIFSLKNGSTGIIIEQLSLYVLPSIMTNIFLCFMTIKVGYKSSMVYRLIMEIPTYLIPIIPDFGNYVESVIRVSVPTIMGIWLYKELEKNRIKPIITYSKKKANKIIIPICIIISLLLVYFISGNFKYKALVIATGSMEPKINIGDVVIVEKMEDEEINSLKVNDVIAYQSDDAIICHRIVSIVNDGNDNLYETKGDANDDSDQFLVKKSQIVGVVKAKIKYVGYPTVLLNRIR